MPVLSVRGLTKRFAGTCAIDGVDLVLDEGRRDMRVECSRGGGLTLEADHGGLDAYVFALAHAGVAIRRLELSMSPLQSMFFALTE
jgi:hypothetical protein